VLPVEPGNNDVERFKSNLQDSMALILDKDELVVLAMNYWTTYIVDAHNKHFSPNNEDYDHDLSVIEHVNLGLMMLESGAY
jgi:hypothetical protein